MLYVLIRPQFACPFSRIKLIADMGEPPFIRLNETIYGVDGYFFVEDFKTVVTWFCISPILKDVHYIFKRVIIGF